MLFLFHVVKKGRHLAAAAVGGFAAADFVLKKVPRKLPPLHFRGKLEGFATTTQTLNSEGEHNVRAGAGGCTHDINQTPTGRGGSKNTLT
jgi:hypothetical protein